MNQLDLIDRIKARLDQKEIPISSVAQDCQTLARRLSIPEWEFYFELQLHGIEANYDKTLTFAPSNWKGDLKTLNWQPAELFLKDRELDAEKIDSNSLESIEFFIRELEESQAASRQREAFKALLTMKRNISVLRSRIRRFISEAESLMSVKIAPLVESGPSIFIGHGQSLIWRDLAMFLKERLGLEHDEFNRTSPAGKTHASRLQEMLERSKFAFLVFSAEDEQKDGTSRARQNVVHEAGLFQGRLGFDKAIILLEEGCEGFSNISGLAARGLSHFDARFVTVSPLFSVRDDRRIYFHHGLLGQIRFPKGQIREKAEEIRAVLEREGLI